MTKQSSDIRAMYMSVYCFMILSTFLYMRISAIRDNLKKTLNNSATVVDNRLTENDLNK